MRVSNWAGLVHSVEMAAPWRRPSSPPCLKTQAWTSALVDGQLHLLKGVFLEDGYEVLVWDMCTMMEEKVERKELIERMKVQRSRVALLTRETRQLWTGL